MENSLKHISVWNDTVALPAFNSLNENLNFDFVVIGGGISGVTLSYLLQKQGAKVVLVEAKHLANGVTGNTTSHLSYIPEISFFDLIGRYGNEKARLAIESYVDAIKFVEKLIKENNIDCDFEYLPAFLFTESKEGIHQIEKNVNAALELGLSPLLTTDMSFPFQVQVVARFDNNAQMHPLKFINGLVKAFINLGGQIFEESRVIKVEDGSSCTVRTSGGSIKAKKVVMATHIPINLNLIQTKITAYCSYVLGLRLNKSMQLKGLFYDDKKPYNYIRSYKDKNNDELIIVGGADHKAGDRSDTLACFRQIEDFARSHFDVKSVDYMWSAELFESYNGLPYIGRLPLNKNIHMITGLSGNGIAGGVMASMLLQDLLLDKENKLAEVYAPTRTEPIIEANKLVAINADVVKHLIQDRISISADNLDSIQLDEGKVLNIHGHQVAVYRDKDGCIHALSPVCTHVGCIVNWNSAEKTWDCPCHGSRFSAMGEVVQAPAIARLKSIEIGIETKVKLKH